MPLFTATFLILEEQLWFTPGTTHAERRSASHRLESYLFEAPEAEAAYAKALDMNSGLSDAHGDGPGDRTQWRSLGLFELQAVDLGPQGLSADLNDGPYGIQVALLQGLEGVPLAPRPREALDVFAGQTAAAPPAVAERLARLHAWLAAQRPDYAKLLQPGASAAQLDAFEARFGLKLPAAFRAFYAWHDGQSPWSSDPLYQNRTWMTLANLADTKAELDGMIGLDFDDPTYWRAGWVPFMENGAGSYLCLDLTAEDGGSPGQLLGFWKADADRPIEAPHFEAWLDDLLQQLTGAPAPTPTPPPPPLPETLAELFRQLDLRFSAAEKARLRELTETDLRELHLGLHAVIRQLALHPLLKDADPAAAPRGLNRIGLPDDASAVLGTLYRLHLSQQRIDRAAVRAALDSAWIMLPEAALDALAEELAQSLSALPSSL